MKPLVDKLSFETSVDFVEFKFMQFQEGVLKGAWLGDLKRLDYQTHKNERIQFVMLKTPSLC